MDVLRSLGGYLKSPIQRSSLDSNQSSVGLDTPTGTNSGVLPRISSRPKLQHSTSVDSAKFTPDAPTGEASAKPTNSVAIQIDYASRKTSILGLASPRSGSNEFKIAGFAQSISQQFLAEPAGLRTRSRTESLTHDEVLRELCATSLQ